VKYFPPPPWFFLNKSKPASLFQHHSCKQILPKSCFEDAKGRAEDGQTAERAKIYEFEKPLKIECNNMCHILINAKSKNIIFDHLTHFYNFFKILPSTLTNEDFLMSKS